MDKPSLAIKFQNALHDILQEIQNCPDDDIQDIANEKLESWECGFLIDHNFHPINNPPKE